MQKSPLPQLVHQQSPWAILRSLFVPRLMRRSTPVKESLSGRASTFYASNLFFCHCPVFLFLIQSLRFVDNAILWGVNAGLYFYVEKCLGCSPLVGSAETPGSMSERTVDAC